jgi:hypothetical protein
VALGRGGALETVPFFGGVFYGAPEEGAIAEAISRLESMEESIRPADLQAWARQFSEEEFLRRMSAVLKATVPGAHDVARPSGCRLETLLDPARREESRRSRRSVCATT